MSEPTLESQSSEIQRFQPIFKGTGQENPAYKDSLPLPPAPTWRRATLRKKNRGETFKALPEEIEMVNAALYLRRPLLVTGKPGTGKTSLAYAVAHELGLGEVLYWPITTRANLKDGLYLYDAIARLQDANTNRPNEGEPRSSGFDNIGDYIRLGPLGTALLPAKKPRILIVDEIDKSEIDLPNDLLYVFEEGTFEIPELVRIEKVKSAVDVRTAYKNRDESTFNDGDTVEEDGKTIINGVKDGKTTIQGGTITCNDVFPLIVLTSNGERDFPPAFLRRCVRLTMEEPGETRLREIVDAHLAQQQQQTEEPSFLNDETIIKLIQDFVKKRNDRTRGDLATDQLLNAVYIVMREREPNLKNREDFINRLWKHLSSSEDQRSDSSPRS